MGVADSGLRGIVQKHLPKARGWLWTPVETGGTHQGIPDSFWAHEPTLTHGWIEHKATKGWVVSVRPHQINWMEHHVRAGVKCHILVRARGAGSSGNHDDSLWAIDGAFIRPLSMIGLGMLPKESILGFWAGPPADWNWRKLQEILTGGKS